MKCFLLPGNWFSFSVVHPVPGNPGIYFLKTAEQESLRDEAQPNRDVFRVGPVTELAWEDSFYLQT